LALTVCIKNGAAGKISGLTSHGDFIVVLDELSGATPDQRNLLGALPAELQHRAKRIRLLKLKFDA